MQNEDVEPVGPSKVTSSFSGQYAELPWPYPTPKPLLLEPPTYGEIPRKSDDVKPSGGWAAFFQRQIDATADVSAGKIPTKGACHG